MYFHHSSSSSKIHLDTMFVIICVIVGITTSHTISDTSKKPINRTNDHYKKSFIGILLDPNLTIVLQSKLNDKNLATAQFKSTGALINKHPATVCALLSNHMSGDQIKFCQRHHDILESILPRLIQTTEHECKRITKDLKWNCPSLISLFEKSSFLAYTREAALVRSILNASMMYLVAKVCSENNHMSCGCAITNDRFRLGRLTRHSSRSRNNVSNEEHRDLEQSEQINSSSRALPELSTSDISKLTSGSPIYLTKSVEQRQGCIINTAFAYAFTKVLIDQEDNTNMNRANKILNGFHAKLHTTRPTNITRLVDSDEKDLAQVRWTKSAINLHNNHIGRKIVRRSIQKRCRCHGISGSCHLQTCWDYLIDFSMIAAQLRSIYIHQSVKTTHKNLKSSETTDLYLTKVSGHDNYGSSSLFDHDGDKVMRINTIGPEELLYIYDSPNYCEPQLKAGHSGTERRACIPTNNITIRYYNNVERTKPIGESDQIIQSYSASETLGLGTCERLCCDRGYQRELVLDVVPCSCRFKFCCRIECGDCLRQIEQYHCL